MLQEYNQKREDPKKCESVAPIDRDWSMTLDDGEIFLFITNSISL